MPGARILIVEDERIVAEDLKETLKNFGYIVVDSVVTGEAAITSAQEHRPDLVMMDIFLAGKMDGIEAAEEIKKTSDIPVIYLTAYADEKILGRARITEPYGYILKPYDEREIRTVIEIALYKHALDEKIRESEERYRLFVQNFLGIAYRTTRAGKPIFYHGIVESLTGYKPEELLAGSPSWKDIVHPDDRKAVEEQDVVLSRPDQSVSREYRIRNKNGTIRWIFELARSGTAGPGTPGFIQGTIYDITSRKRAEEGIKKRDNVLMAIGSAVEWFLREPLMTESKGRAGAGSGDIATILEQMGIALGISSVGIFAFSPDYSKITLTSEWVGAGTTARIFNNSLKDVPFASAAPADWADRIRKGSVAAGILDNSGAAGKGLLLADFGFRSAGLVPLIVQDNVWGFMGFLDKTPREWDAEEMEGLRIVANIMGVILHQQAEAAGNTA